MDALGGFIAPELKNDREKVVVLKADTDTPLGYTVKIIDIVKEAGGKRLTITTKKSGKLTE